jgi:hypothetical protein
VRNRGLNSCDLQSGVASQALDCVVSRTGIEPGCNYTPSSPCRWIGTFEANDDTTVNLICPSGTISETYWFPHGRGPFTIAERTWTCSDGSTLVMRVSRYAFIPLTETTGEILETWVITEALVGWQASRAAARWTSSSTWAGR